MSKTLLTALAATLLFVAPAVAGPAIAGDWATLDVSQAECFARGEAAIKRMNFTGLEQTRYSRFGQDGDYTVSVRCIEEKGVVLFLAAGPDRSRALELQIELHRNYLKWNNEHARRTGSRVSPWPVGSRPYVLHIGVKGAVVLAQLGADAAGALVGEDVFRAVFDAGNDFRGDVSGTRFRGGKPRRHIGVDVARIYADHARALPAQLKPQGFRDRPHRRLRRAIGCLHRHVHPAHDGEDIDDGAATVLP